MAKFLKRVRRAWEAPALLPLRALAYAVMLLLISIYFAGGGVFIYEAF